LNEFNLRRDSPAQQAPQSSRSSTHRTRHSLRRQARLVITLLAAEGGQLLSAGHLAYRFKRMPLTEVNSSTARVHRCYSNTPDFSTDALESKARWLAGPSEGNSRGSSVPLPPTTP